ncbi:MAG TPA: prepilin-type N-terminal cleavage/methylation domain-containing protein [Mycobacteriales bacterium]|nr:prepilin-type N-terminal cleavage/methylation domain-containing protein [Mycobacteriales bacterium]
MNTSQIQQRLRKGGDQGFTLVELLIVIVVLGILSGIVLFGVARFRSDANNAACKADVATVSVAADAYDAATGNYPSDVATLVTGQYLKSTPSGTYAFNATTKTVTRTPACS